MRDLTVVGLSRDKSRLVLVDDAGVEFSVAADATLRAALRGDTARPAQLEIRMDSALRPRDIQTRIRGGESPETVAAAAQTTVERIMAFAAPVLAERAHIATTAQKASVRRRAGDGPSGVLAEAVTERLRARGVDPDAVDWDAWRREDGRWAVVADYRSGGSARHAEFGYDVQGRYVVAEDDEARWLVGERTTSHGPQPRGAAPTPRRLGSVADTGPVLEGDEGTLPLGEDALELVSESAEESPVPSQRTDAPTRLRPDADWILTQASARPVAPPVEHVEHVEPVVEEPVAEEPAAVETAVPAAPTASAEEPAGEPADAPRRGRRKPGRASVPSWDEIMFGSGKAE